jgi:hypothetical protein
MEEAEECRFISDMLGQLGTEPEGHRDRVAEELVARLNDDTVNRYRVGALCKASLAGDSEAMRLVTWLVNLEVLPSERADWEGYLHRSVKHYLECRRSIYQRFVGFCQGLSQAALRGSERLRENVALYEQIEKDCLRTFSGMSFFNRENPRTELPFITKARKEKVRQLGGAVQGQTFTFDCLIEILFVFGICHEEMGYMQGMSDILAVVFYLFNHSRL